MFDRSFYCRNVTKVARDLVGAHMHWRESTVRIVETEAYGGEGDAASHAAPGPTERNRVMFGPPGIVYVYLIYGMYHCLNVVTEAPDSPSAVLIRAAEPIDSRHEMGALSGPGRLCRALEIDRSHTGLDTTNGPLTFEVGRPPQRLAESTRIGIRKAADRQWRFFDPDSSAVSGTRSQNEHARITRHEYAWSAERSH